MSFLLDTGALVAAIALGAVAAGFAGRGLFAGLSRAERVAWAVWTGLALEAAIYLVALAVGERPGPAVMFGATALLAAAARVLGRRKPALPETRPGRLAAAALLFAAIAVALFAVVALSEPMWSNDWLAIWGLKGKTIYLSGGIPDRLFHDPVSAWSHPEYPLGLPAILAGLSAAIGRWDDHALAVVFPVIAAATAAAIYGWTKRRFSPAAGAVAALLAAAFFPLYAGFEVGMAEIPLSLALVLFGAAALDFSEAPTRAAAGRLALAAFLAASVKQEGALFALLASGWMALREIARRSGRAVPVLSLAAAPVVLHQLAMIAARGVIADRDFDGSFARPERWAELARRGGQALSHLVRPEDATTWIALLALAAFAAAARPVRGVPALALLGPPLLAQAAVYVAVCAFSAFDPAWQVVFVPRLLRALFPVALLALAPRLAFVCEGSRSVKVPAE